MKKEEMDALNRFCGDRIPLDGGLRVVATLNASEDKIDLRIVRGYKPGQGLAVDVSELEYFIITMPVTK